MDNSKLTYRDAGVDIDAGNALVDDIKREAARTLRPEVVGGLGGFGGLFEMPPGRWRHPVLVAGTDGVGTKLKLAGQLGEFRGLGVDLVAMCVNDVLVQGAEPLFFLDYYATGKLDRAQAAEVVAGVADGCEQAGAALIGGETAELPGLYARGDFDLAGFCVGAVEKDSLIDGHRVRPGDQLIGLSSSGPHANGYSLIRKVIERSGASLDAPLDQQTLGRALLTPTRIYVQTVQAVLATTTVHAMAHITGGGLPENLPRVLPAGCAAKLDTSAWTRPPVFDWLQREGSIDDMEMYRTFNCGIGFVLVVPQDELDNALRAFTARGEQALRIGEIVPAREGQTRVVIG